jgi:hypothetical protein
MESTTSFTVPESLAVSDSGFLFLASSGETFTLNAIGKEIFLMLKDGLPLATMKEKVAAEYDVDASMLERDIEDFLNQLKSFKLIAAK